MIVATQSNSTTKSIVKKEMACADMTIDDIHKPHMYTITSYNTVRMGERPASSHHAKVKGSSQASDNIAGYNIKKL